MMTTLLAALLLSLQDPQVPEGFTISKAADVLKVVVREDHIVPLYRERYGHSLIVLGEMYFFAGRPAEAEERYREALAVAEPLARENPAVSSFQAIVSQARDDLGHLSANEIGCQRRQPIVMSFGPAVFDRHIVALDIAGFLKPLAERGHHGRMRFRRRGVEKSNHRHRRLLRVRRPRPDGHTTAYQRDELASPHGLPSQAGS